MAILRVEVRLQINFMLERIDLRDPWQAGNDTLEVIFFGAN